MRACACARVCVYVCLCVCESVSECLPVLQWQVTEEYDLHNLETGGIGAQVPYHNALA